MKFLLLHSADDPDGSIRFHKYLMPLNLGIIAGYLRENNINVKSYDLNINIVKNYNERLKEKYLQIYDKEFFLDCLDNPDRIEYLTDLFQNVLEGIDIQEYDFVGISAGTRCSFFEVHFAFLLGKLIKLKYNKPVVFGGMSLGLFATNNSFANEAIGLILKNFKYLFYGPGERSLVQLLQAYENGTVEEVYPTLKGAAYVSSDGTIKGNVQDQPTLCRPDFSDIDLEDYKIVLSGTDEEENVRLLYKLAFPYNVGLYSYIGKNVRDKSNSINIIPYYFNVNCPYKCAFCSQSDKSVKPKCKTVNEVIDDIIYLQKQCNSHYFFFLNNAVNFTPVFLRDFCTSLINKRIKIFWSDCARFNGLTKELLELMYKAGCRKLVFGFETGSEKMLKFVNKKLELEQVENVLKWCSETGINAEIEVIVGLPYENDEDFEATYSFIQKNKEFLNFVHSTRYYIIGNSSIGMNPEKYGIEFLQGETYDSILAWVKNLSKKNFKWDPEDAGKTPNHVLVYNEINGRSPEIIEKESSAKYAKMIALNETYPGCTEMYEIVKNMKSRAGAEMARN